MRTRGRSLLDRVGAIVAVGVVTTSAFGVAAAAAVAGPVFRYTDLLIPTRDGKQLAADLYYVDATPQPKPVVLVQTPYDRSRYRLPATRGSDVFPVSDAYNIVVLDWRGFYGSTPAAVAGYDRGLDGFDAVEWIAAQSWSDGRIGTWGSSALGYIQFLTARHRPPHLLAAVPRVKDFMTLYEQYYYGGAYRKEHIESLEQLGFLDPATVLAHPSRDATWDFIENGSGFAADIAVPMFVIGGWYDHFPSAVLRAFEDLRLGSDPTVRGLHKLLYGPWGHGNLGDPAQGELTYANANATDLAARELRFLDRYVRGSANGWEFEPVAQYYQMGNDEWRSAPSWTGVPRVDHSLYLGAGGTLGDVAPAPGLPPDQFVYDPVDPTPAWGGSRFAPFDPTVLTGPLDLRAVVESRADVLVYSTEVLTSELRINGAMSLGLYVASDRTDTDFCVRVADVYPDGRSIIVTQGVRRARYRDGFASESLITPGTIYPVTIALEELALTILPGHRLRLDISSADAPHFDPNRNDGGPLYVPGPTLVATNTIYHDEAHPSQLRVRLLPADPVTEVSASPSPYPLYVVESAASPTGVYVYFERQAGSAGYNLYEGTLAGAYDHRGVDCNLVVEDAGTGWLRAPIPTTTGGAGYLLVTAFNATVEGPAGYNGGSEIPPALSDCPP